MLNLGEEKQVFTKQKYYLYFKRRFSKMRIKIPTRGSAVRTLLSMEVSVLIRLCSWALVAKKMVCCKKSICELFKIKDAGCLKRFVRLRKCKFKVYNWFSSEDTLVTLTAFLCLRGGEKGI